MMTPVHSSQEVAARVAASLRVSEPDPEEYDQPAHYNESGLYTWQERVKMAQTSIESLELEIMEDGLG